MPCPRSLASALVAISLVAGVSACSDDEAPERGRESGPTGATASTFPVDPRVSPETLTEALLVLWLDRDREQADRLGGDAAMDALFAVAPPEELPDLLGCSPEAQLREAMTCVARGGGVVVVVTVQEHSEGWQAVAARANR